MTPSQKSDATDWLCCHCERHTKEGRTMRSFALKLALAGATLAGLATGSAHADALPTPAMAGPLAANANPYSIDLPDWLGDAGGKVYVGGAVSGIAFYQSSPIDINAGDDASFIDISNAQV